MSNSIWKTPTVRPAKDCIVVWQNPARMSFTLPRTARKYMEMYNCERWTTLDDLIAQADKAEQLQKAQDALNWLNEYLTEDKVEENVAVSCQYLKAKITSITKQDNK